MIILYGSKTSLKQGKKLGSSICPNCGHYSEKILGKEVYKSHIFYIPVFCYVRHRGKICAVCGMYEEMDAAKYKELNA